jgi:23S rRNA pseudouridine1911/1915/1917 synthase
MAHIHHPVVGDEVYGGARWRGVQDSKLKTLAKRFGRPALHAHILGIVHPVTGETLEWEAPMPNDMLEFVGVLNRAR